MKTNHVCNSNLMSDSLIINMNTHTTLVANEFAAHIAKRPVGQVESRTPFLLVSMQQIQQTQRTYFY